MEAKVNKKTYILLAVFLGMFGAHEFYAKRVKSGLLYLIFCWTAVPFLLGLYDAIKASTIAKDENGKISISDKQNKLIPIAIATALVVSSVFFAPKSKPETTKKEPVKTVQKTKKAPELKKASDEKKYDKKANEQFANYLMTEFNNKLAETGTDETVNVEYYDANLIYIYVNQDYKYLPNVEIQKIVDTLYQAKNDTFAKWAIENGYDATEDVPHLYVFSQDKTELAKEKFLDKGMKLSIDNN